MTTPRLRRVDWSHICESLRAFHIDHLRTRLVEWGCSPSIAAVAEPVAFIWVPAGPTFIVPGGLLRAGDRWVTLVAQGPLRGPYSFRVMTRSNRPANELLADWKTETVQAS